GRLGALAAGQGRVGEATPKSLKVARTFDSIGRRNESLRAQLDAVEFSFRNIELIRSQFYDALGPIDQTLRGGAETRGPDRRARPLEGGPRRPDARTQ